MNVKINLKNSKGYTLVEVMMVVGLMGLVGLGAASMMKNAMSIQSRQQLRPTIRQIKFEIEQSFLNDTSWENTYNHASNNTTGIQCLRTGANCADNTVANAIVLRDSNNTVVFDETGAANGWRFDGTPCTAWVAGGTDACPIRYDLSVRMDCPNGAPTCQKPTAHLTGNLQYRPLDRTATGKRVNVLEYAIDVRRGEVSTFQPFRLLMRQEATNDNGGLGCTSANTWSVRPLNRLEPTGANAPIGVTFNDANDRFTLVAGNYKCEIMVESFGQVDGFKIAIRQVGTNNRTPAGAGISPAYGIVVSHFNFFLSPVATTTYQVEQYCANGANGGGHSDSVVNHANYEFGVPAGASATGVESPPFGTGIRKIFTEVSCVRSS